MDGAPAPAAAPRTDIPGMSFPRGCAQQHQADRDLIGSSHQQEDLQEDGQDPGTSVCAVILSTNQLASFPVEDG